MIPSYRTLHEDPAPDPLPWWLEWDLIAIGCCLCIAAATLYAIGRL